MDWNQLPGSLDFIPTVENTAYTVIDAVNAARIASFDTGSLICTGGFGSLAKTYIIDVSSNPATKIEIKSEGISFGGADIAIKNGLAYIADGGNAMYVVNEIGVVVGKFPVGGTGEMITNLVGK